MTMHVLAPLWHPPEGGYSGGAYRAKRLIEQCDIEFDIVDTDTSDLPNTIDNGTIFKIAASALYASGALLRLSRVINWLWVCLVTILYGLWPPRKVDAVYVSFSELIHVSLAAWVIAAIRRKPLILCNLNIRGTTLWGLNRIIHNKASLVITLSEALKAELRENGITAPIAVNGTGVDDFSVPVAGVVAYDAIFVGRHTREKGVFDLVEIWSLVCRKHPNAVLAMVGPCLPDVRAYLEDLISAVGMERNIRVLGALGESEKWEAYSRSRICAFPSHVEGWGIVPIEAHLAGLPVVAYDLPAYVENIGSSPGAVLVPIGDKAAFAEAVATSLNRAWDAPQLRRWARRFDWPNIAKRESALIESISGNDAKFGDVRKITQGGV